MRASRSAANPEHGAPWPPAAHAQSVGRQGSNQYMQPSMASTTDAASRAAELRTRARTAAMDLLKTVVSLSTGSVAVIFAMLTDKDTIIKPGPQRVSIFFAVCFFVVAVFVGLSGWLANSQRYYQKSLAIEEVGTKHHERLSARFKKIQLTCFFFLPVFFWLGVLCAGIYILLRA